jgi:transposase
MRRSCGLPASRSREVGHFLLITRRFPLGECAQIDWGEYGSIGVGSTRRRLSFFVMVLCYSRLMYVEFTVSQTMESQSATNAH